MDYFKQMNNYGTTKSVGIFNDKGDATCNVILNAVTRRHSPHCRQYCAVSVTLSEVKPHRFQSALIILTFST